MGDVESGKCTMCNQEGPVARTYYYYDMDCNCCNGHEHFEIVWTCMNCKPEPPEVITLTGQFCRVRQ